MPKCRDNWRRKKKRREKEARIKKWCDNYFSTHLFPGAKGSQIGGFNFYPHPWRKKKNSHHTIGITKNNKYHTVGITKNNKET